MRSDPKIMSVQVWFEQRSRPEGLSVRVDRASTPQEDEPIRNAQLSVEAVLKASNCQMWRFEVKHLPAMKLANRADGYGAPTRNTRLLERL